MRIQYENKKNHKPLNINKQTLAQRELYNIIGKIMKKILWTLAAMAASLVMVSCSGTPDIKGDWNVVSIGGEPVLLTEQTPFLNFDSENGQIHGNTTVNIINGSYSLVGKKITFENLGTTMMAGPMEAMTQEQNFLSAINSAVKVELSEQDELTLKDASGNALMVLKRK